MTWFIILHEFLFFGVGVDFFLGEISLGRRGDVGIAPYEIPLPCRASPFSRGDERLPSPLRWDFPWTAGRCGHRPLRDPPALSGIPLFKGDERLLRPVGHLLWERRLSGERCSPLRWDFPWAVGRCGHRPLRDPPALSGIPLFKGDEGLLRPSGTSSGRGGFTS